MTNRNFDNPKCGFKIDSGNDCIITDGSVHEKITGTSFGAVLGHNPWMSPFEAACHLLGLINELGLDKKPAIIVGKTLELPIIEYLNCGFNSVQLDDGTQLDTKFVPAENLDICSPREGSHNEWVSDWDDPIFAGHIDGVAINNEGTSILEIKTVKNIESWNSGIPEHYRDQVRLYNYFLTGIGVAYVGVGHVNSDTYKNPKSWVPNCDNVELYTLEMDSEDTETDVESARGWYNRFILNNRTPSYNPELPRDVEIWNFLTNLMAPETEIREDIDKLAELKSKINAHHAEIKSIADEADILKNNIRSYLVNSQMEHLDSYSEMNSASITVYFKKTLDEEKMEEDGIDVEKYAHTTKINTLRIKNRT